MEGRLGAGQGVGAPNNFGPDLPRAMLGPGRPRANRQRANNQVCRKVRWQKLCLPKCARYSVDASNALPAVIGPSKEGTSPALGQAPLLLPERATPVGLGKSRCKHEQRQAHRH